MTVIILHWIWSLPDQDLASLIGVTLIGSGIAVAVLRKIGDWS